MGSLRVVFVEGVDDIVTLVHRHAPLGVVAGARVERALQRYQNSGKIAARVVAQVGGWSSFQAVEPPNAPSEAVINDEFAAIEIV